MSRSADYKAKAAKCRDLAEAARDERGRKLWSDMEQYWLRRGQSLGQPADGKQMAVVDDEDAVSGLNSRPQAINQP